LNGHFLVVAWFSLLKKIKSNYKIAFKLGKYCWSSTVLFELVIV